MQNRYTADVGDFGKYALLNWLVAGSDLRLGVVWYLNVNQESNQDGRFTDYSALRKCDPALHDKLSAIVRSGRRTVQEIEQAKILPPETVFYSRFLPSGICGSAAEKDTQTRQREQWFNDALKELRHSNLVFLDPDNGIAGERVMPFHKKAAKYAFEEEVHGWLQGRHSVVLYQHRDRTVTQIPNLLDKFGQYKGWVLIFRRKSVRIFFVLPATENHRDLLRGRIQAFSKTLWIDEQHFRLH